MQNNRSDFNILYPTRRSPIQSNYYLYKDKEWLETSLKIFSSVKRVSELVGVACSTISYWKKKFNLPRKKIVITKTITRYRPPLREVDNIIYVLTKGVELNLLEITKKYGMNYREIIECFYKIIKKFPDFNYKYLLGLVVYIKNTHITKHKISDFLGIDYSSFCKTSKGYYHLIEEEFGNLKFNMIFI